MNPSELKDIIKEREKQLHQRIENPTYQKLYVTIDENIEKGKKEFIVTPNNDYVMKCIFQKYGKQVSIPVVEENVLFTKKRSYKLYYINDYIIVKTRDKDGEKALKFVKCNDQHGDVLKKEFEKMLGFTKVIQLISKKKVAIVGFNCMLDLYYIFQKFIKDIPENFFKFQKILLKHFGEIYDVGHIIRDKSVGKYFENRHVSSLESIYNFLIEKKLVKEIKSSGFHNAGFDSKVTGYVFQWARSKFNEENKVPMSVMLKNIMFNYRGIAIYLDKPEPERETRNMFIVERKKDLSKYNEMFSKYGDPKKEIIDENFCYFQVRIVDPYGLPKPWKLIVDEICKSEDIHTWKDGKKLLIDYMKTFTSIQTH